MNAQGVTTSSAELRNLNFASDDKSGGEDGAGELPFFSRIVVNRNDPNRLAIATNYAYTTTDARLLDDPAPLTNLGAIVGTIGKFVGHRSGLRHAGRRRRPARRIDVHDRHSRQPRRQRLAAAGQPHDAAHAPGQLRRRCADLRGIR